MAGAATRRLGAGSGDEGVCVGGVGGGGGGGAKSFGVGAQSALVTLLRVRGRLNIDYMNYIYMSG